MITNRFQLNRSSSSAISLYIEQSFKEALLAIMNLILLRLDMITFKIGLICSMLNTVKKLLAERIRKCSRKKRKVIKDLT